MERGLNRMVERGYQIENQSGEFSGLFTYPYWKRSRVVVTYRLAPETPAEPESVGPPSEPE